MSDAALPCSDASRAAGEPLAGTALHATSWLLVEVPGPWPRDVSDGASLPEQAREAVAAWLERFAPARLLFVRRPGRAAGGRLAFVARVEESRGEIRRFELESPEELAACDLDGGGEMVDSSLVLVCGHGSRDRCCARRGTEVFGALVGELPDEGLWISSHQGGHRFAANALVLPSGIQLGRLDPGDAWQVIAGALAGRVDLRRYRGRACFPPPVQAAEHALRAELGLDELGALRLAGAEGSLVRFRTREGGAHAVHVEEVAGRAVPASCGAAPEPQRAFAASPA